MSRQHHLCIVVADGGRARLIRQSEDHRLHTFAMVESPAIHKKSSEMISDGPGRSFESASPTRHAIEPHTNPHLEAKHEFAEMVGSKLCTETALKEFDRVLLVAPAPILADIQKSLDAAVAGKVIGTVAKDLTKVPDNELQPHLQDWVRPPSHA